MIEGFVYGAGILTFIIAIMFFLYLKNHYPKREFFALSGLIISSLTLISYSIMGFNLDLITIDSRTFHWTRLLFSAVTSSLLIAMAGKAMRKPCNRIIELVFTTVMVLFSGLIASLTSEVRLLFVLISLGSFAYLLYVLNSKTKNQPAFAVRVKWFINLTWSAYPMIWLASPTGYGLINSLITSIAYLIMDFLTKVLFTYFLVKRPLSHRLTRKLSQKHLN